MTAGSEERRNPERRNAESKKEKPTISSKRQPHQKRPRVGTQIRAPRVLVIAPDGERIGELELEAALYLADELGLDLVEVAPDATPPVCRILDYGKHRYEQSRREREARKKKPKEAKTIQLRPRIAEGDYQTKLRAAQKFLKSGHQVVAVIQLHGREQSAPQTGFDLANRVVADLAEAGTATGHPVREGRNITVRIDPARTKNSQTDQAA